MTQLVRVQSVKPLEGFTVDMHFTDGTRRTYIIRTETEGSIPNNILETENGNKSFIEEL